jgi:hypothetical protein
MIVSKYGFFRITAEWQNLSLSDDSHLSKGSSFTSIIQLPSTDENYNSRLVFTTDRLCGLVVRVLGYRSGGPGSILGTTRKKK